MSSNRWLIAAGVALLLIVIASVAVGTRGTGDTEFPAGTPEGAVQQYVRAIRAQDAEALLALLSPDTERRCELGDIRNAFRYPSERDLRVTLRDTKITDNRAVVRVRVTEGSGSGGLFDSGTYDHDETLDLVRIDGRWLIDQPTWPVYCQPKLVPPTPTPTPDAPTPTPTSSAAPTRTPSN